MKILGIDEAGRGPVLGSMMICGYLIDESKRAELKASGAKDSKLLAPAKREAIAAKLRDIADDYVVLKAGVKEIDEAVDKGNLNVLEMEKMAEIIRTLRPDKAIVDCPETNTARFARRLSALAGMTVIAENYADATYVEVSAASILAKSEREKEIALLHKEHGFFGTGYTSDERTITFLKDWLERNKGLPGFARKSWITSQVLVATKEQRTLKWLNAERD
ncbi:MAG: ribonuclease HII [Candidatus Aenigmarchaeota archaeon]|nr:ribonuclease HII [Candidatus Aenigmarchaeota archaeon]